ncbi:ABC transporter permease [Enterococcus sp. LJL98]
MSMFQRAWFYILRKKGKTVIMFFILFGIATATISGVAIKKATSVSREQANQSLNSNFSLRQDPSSGLSGTRGFGNVPGSLVEEIKKNPAITGYDAKALGEAQLTDFEQIPLESESIQISPEQIEKYKKIIDIEGSFNSKLDNKFESKQLTLTKGRHLTPQDKNKVLIHEDFARANQLELGDMLNLNASPYQSINPNFDAKKDQVIGTEIIGLFSGKNEGNPIYSSDLYENIFFTDLETVKQINQFTDDTLPYQELKFYVKNPNELDKVLKEVKSLPIDWEKYELMDSSYTYPGMDASLNSMDQLINKMLIGTIVISAAILSLILIFWINGRIHESGVLLSIGISKVNIISQYILELFLIAVPSFILSYFSGQLIAQNIGNQLVEQAKEQGEAMIRQGFGGMPLGSDAGSNLLTKTMDHLDVSIRLSEMLNVWFIGMLIIVVSVLIASTFIIRLKPKEILSKMS